MGDVRTVLFLCPPNAAKSVIAAAMLAEGIDVRAHCPRRVTAEELARASRVVSLGCDLGDLAPPGLVIEHWDDVPSPSADLTGARAVIAAHVRRVVDTDPSTVSQRKERHHEMDHA
jgi:protein-tyrosine-phosphatase